MVGRSKANCCKVKHSLWVILNRRNAGGIILRSRCLVHTTVTTGQHCGSIWRQDCMPQKMWATVAKRLCSTEGKLSRYCEICLARLDGQHISRCCTYGTMGSTNKSHAFVIAIDRAEHGDRADYFTTTNVLRRELLYRVRHCAQVHRYQQGASYLACCRKWRKSLVVSDQQNVI